MISQCLKSRDTLHANISHQFEISQAPRKQLDHMESLPHGCDILHKYILRI